MSESPAPRRRATEEERRALTAAAEALGGQAAVAAACGFKDRRNVFPWFSEGRMVPAEHCPAIERATRLRAAQQGDPSLIVTCEQLRPDIAWDVLRMQALPTDTAPITGPGALAA